MAIKEKPTEVTSAQNQVQTQVFASDEDVRRIVKRLRKDYANTLRDLAK